MRVVVSLSVFPTAHFSVFLNQIPRYVPLIVNAVRFHPLSFACPVNSGFLKQVFELYTSTMHTFPKISCPHNGSFEASLIAHPRLVEVNL